MVQIVEQTHDEKVEMYKKCTKMELIGMLISSNFHLEAVTKQLNKLSVGGPASASVSEGEQLGNEAGAKGVSVGFWCIEHDRFGNNKCKRQCELCETEGA